MIWSPCSTVADFADAHRPTLSILATATQLTGASAGTGGGSDLVTGRRRSVMELGNRISQPSATTPHPIDARKASSPSPMMLRRATNENPHSRDENSDDSTRRRPSMTSSSGCTRLLSRVGRRSLGASGRSLSSLAAATSDRSLAVATVQTLTRGWRSRRIRSRGSGRFGRGRQNWHASRARATMSPDGSTSSVLGFTHPRPISRSASARPTTASSPARGVANSRTS